MKSPLNDIERAAGAAFKLYHNWELPEVFTDVIDEYQAVRQAAGLFDLSSYGRLEITGPERASFLHNMVSNDVKALKPGKGVYAALLTTHGKLLSDLYIFAQEDRLLVDTSAVTRETVFATLNRFLVSEKAAITDASHRVAKLLLQGPRSFEWLNGWTPVPDLRPLDVATIFADGMHATIARVSHTGEDGYELTVPRENAASTWSRLRRLGVDLGATAVGMAAFNLLRVEAGIPWYGTDMDESNIVLEAGLDHAISTTKGCYVGQETVARITFRGQVNKKLTGLFIEGESAPPADSRVLREGQTIGRVTSVVRSPALRRTIALAYLHRDYLRPGERVEVEFGAATMPAEVTALPFYRRPASGDFAV
ncbi:MAG: aminomethyl transferase family protein [Acidobacteria bacterium]|nr:aminomethyl transferase family protein [Acidobacteriota bacterium]MBI3657289.1 aminomethyl transferase family protein [Acidobacteriota bacterium]